MSYTVSDVQETYQASIRLVAGMGGLARPVREVGILDYELLPEVKQRHQRVNFYEEQLVLSTFLYAKEDAFYITEAVKYLVSKGCSGLVIKNVFHLQIPDGAIRYANARNFPLFVTTNDTFMFDEVIARVDRTVRQMASAVQLQRELDLLLADRGDAAITVTRARSLNPSLRNEHLALYVQFEGGLGGERQSPEQHFAQLEERLGRSELAFYTNLFMPYNEGLLLVVSGDRMIGDGNRRTAEGIVEQLRDHVLDSDSLTPYALGTSETHYELFELPETIDEAVRAARFAAHEGKHVMYYCDLGAYRLILPHLDSPAYLAFEQAILEPLRSYDAETGTHLVDTLRSYCSHNQSFALTSAALGQHENTVRRRLDRVADITGLSYRVADQMEQLSMACKIERCRKVMS